MRPKPIIGVVLAVLALIFVFQNIEVIEVRFLVWSATVSGSLLLSLVLAAGIAIGWLWHGVVARRAARRTTTQTLH